MKIVSLFLLGAIICLSGCAGPGAYIETKNLEEAEKWEDAYQQYKVQLEKYPKDTKTQKALVAAGQKASKLRYDKAKGIFESNHELNSPIAHLEQALIFDPQNKEAFKVLNELQERKNNALNLLAVSLNFQKKGVYLKAVESVRKAIEAYPDNVDMQNALKDIEAKAIESYKEKASSLSSEQKWKDALELYKELQMLFLKDEQIADSIKKLETKNSAQEKLIEAERLLNEKKLEDSLKLVQEALKLFPEYERAQQLLARVKMAIAQEYIEKGRLYFKQGDWIEALKQYTLAEEFVKELEGLRELKEDAKNKLVEFYYNNGINLYGNKKYKEAFFELLKIFDYKQNYKDTKSKLDEIQKAWATELYAKALEHEVKGDFGNALLESIAVEMLTPEKEEVQSTIDDLKNSIRDKVTFRIAIFGIENFSQNPELGGRLVDGIFERLLQKSIDTLQIIDRSSEEDVRYEAKLTGAELAKLKPISAFIDGSIYPLKIDLKQEITREAKKLKVGSVKSPNPRRVEIIARMNAVGSTVPGYQSQYLSQTAQTAQDFRYLSQMSQTYPVGYPGDSADALLTLFGMFGSMQAQDKLASAQNELAKLQQELNSIPEFIEEPKYTTLDTGGDNYIKTARLRCYLKIRDFATRQPFFTQEIEEIEAVNDRFVKGDEEAGIASDPLDLPSDTELGEKVIQNLIDKTGNVLYDKLKNYGFAYYNLAKQSVVSKDNVTATERCFDFLSSYTAKFYPEEASDSFAYLEANLKEIVPLEARKKEIKISELFPNIKQIVEAYEEEKHKAKLYEEKINLAKSYIEKKDWQSAIYEAKEALKVKPEENEPNGIIKEASLEQRKDMLIKEARNYFSQSNFEKTLELTNIILKHESDNSEAKELRRKAALKILPAGFTWKNDKIVICERDKSEMILITKISKNYNERFLIDKHEITNKQFSEFISQTGYQAQGKWKQCYKEGQDDYPVRNVTYEDAKTYARWSGKDLPTEGQWEYAARGNSKQKYPWGNEFKIEKEKSKFSTEVRAVGLDPLDVSSFGCYDMAGNVSEWLRGIDYSYAVTQSLRGGSFENKAAEQSYDTKIEIVPNRALPHFGLRCVKELEDVKEDILRPTEQTKIRNSSSMKLEGIVYDEQPDKRTAIINGTIVKERDYVDDFHVRTILQKSVILFDMALQQEIALELNPMQTNRLEGKIIVINKDYNFLVINLGVRNGILKEDSLSVYHEESYIGDVKVTDARENNCVADISLMSERFKNQIQIGDKIIKRQ
ncbi:MAG: SUMF1/EgtB/PvdO family nonheme iron enzyme [Candidatus Omnitrophica bacterium]|nr:SUMF1/EgtB/PvdO family nonheme iron enzyme [Candidatus Omnitrophota bacterium]